MLIAVNWELRSTGTSHEKVYIFCHSFQKVKPIYYIDSLNIEWNISSLYFLKFWWLLLTDNENPKFSFPKIFLYRNVRLLKSLFISMHSILGWASFCMNYCINAAWHETISPWHCSGVMKPRFLLIAAFRSSALLGLVSLIFLLTIPIDSLLQVRRVCCQSSTVTPWSLNQLLVPLAVWAGAKSP